MAELTKSELAGKLWVGAKVPRRYWPRRLGEVLQDPRCAEVWERLQFAVEHGLPHILRFDEWDDRLMQLHAEIVRAACVKGKSGLFYPEPWLSGDGFVKATEAADVLVVVIRCSAGRQWAVEAVDGRLAHLIDKRYWENKATLILHDAAVSIGDQVVDRVRGYHAQHVEPVEPPPVVRSAPEMKDKKTAGYQICVTDEHPEEPIAVAPRAPKVKAKKARRPKERRISTGTGTISRQPGPKKKEAKADEGS